MVEVARLAGLQPLQEPRRPRGRVVGYVQVRIGLLLLRRRRALGVQPGQQLLARQLP